MLRLWIMISARITRLFFAEVQNKLHWAIHCHYLSKEELQALERIVTMYLDYAEYQAGRHIPMTMQNWSQRLNSFLQFNEHEILHDTGRVTHEIAKPSQKANLKNIGSCRTGCLKVTLTASSP